MIVFLVGYMGSGKTTIGTLLADSLSYDFVDTDDVLEADEKQSCSMLMRNKGEKYFREAEKKVLHQVIQKNRVIATGGGMPCFSDNMDFMNQHGCTIFLDWTSENLAVRLEMTDISKRPMLCGKTKVELRQHIQTQLSNRLSFYSQAKYTIVCNEKNDEEILQQIRQYIVG